MESLHIDPAAHVRMDPSQSVTMLGRHSFNTTVNQEHVDNWIVLFCVDWLEHCQGLWHDYRRMATHWEHALAPHASSWRTSAVRFAEVDCATDKPLCNENHVQMYPSVVHYKGGKFLKAWDLSKSAKSLSADISKWIGKELSPKLMREAPSNKEGSSAQSFATTTSASIKALFKALRQSLGKLLHEFVALLSWKTPATAAGGCFILAVAVAVFAWVVSTGLELDVQTTLASLRLPQTSSGKDAKMPWSTGFLPELKEMAAPRTIVRGTMEL